MSEELLEPLRPPLEAVDDAMPEYGWMRYDCTGGVGEILVHGWGWVSY